MHENFPFSAWLLRPRGLARPPGAPRISVHIHAPPDRCEIALSGLVKVGLRLSVNSEAGSGESRCGAFTGYFRLILDNWGSKVAPHCSGGYQVQPNHWRGRLLKWLALRLKVLWGTAIERLVSLNGCSYGYDQRKADDDCLSYYVRAVGSQVSFPVQQRGHGFSGE